MTIYNIISLWYFFESPKASRTATWPGHDDMMGDSWVKTFPLHAAALSCKTPITAIGDSMTHPTSDSFRCILKLNSHPWFPMLHLGYLRPLSASGTAGGQPQAATNVQHPILLSTIIHHHSPSFTIIHHHSPSSPPSL